MHSFFPDIHFKQGKLSTAKISNAFSCFSIYYILVLQYCAKKIFLNIYIDNYSVEIIVSAIARNKVFEKRTG